MSGYQQCCSLCRKKVPKHYCFKCNEKLCKTCVKYHLENKYLASHKLCDIEAEPEDPAYFDYLCRLTKCKEHNEKDVKYLCKDHNEVCCNECAIINHRKCNDLISVTRQTTTGDSKSFNESLAALERKVKTLRQHDTQHLANVKRSKEAVEQHLRELKEKLDQAFFKFERAALNETARVQESLLGPLEKQLSSIRSFEESVKDVKKKLQLVENFGLEIHKILLEREMSDTVKDLEQKLEQLCNNTSCQELKSDGLNHLMDGVVGCLNARNAARRITTAVPETACPYLPTEDVQCFASEEDESEEVCDYNHSNTFAPLGELGEPGEEWEGIDVGRRQRRIRRKQNAEFEC